MMCASPKTVYPNGGNKPQLVPCTKCVACLSNKRNDWVFRLLQEHKVSCGALFVTLTYHPKYVPDEGLNKRHFQLFMKRLRKRCPDRLRYYAVGEYGSKCGRPHYHALIFNLYDEKFIRESWVNPRNDEPFGIVHIGKVNEASIRYTTKYIIQLGGYVPHKTKPFALMSRAYGIGAHYLTDNMIAWHRNGDYKYSNYFNDFWWERVRNYTMIEGVKGRLPRYYKEKIWPDKDVRGRLGKYCAWQARIQARKNIMMLKSLGYNEPSRILAEMRNAVMQRVKQKVAFSQTI